ncbi:MAG: hypothetical protein U9N48_00120 [Euryarchaeota archaeon]|nr:hypothetical protein [Euryarchaeota archaeon]
METSNFSESGSDPRAVAISRSRPKSWNGRVYEKLAPSWALIRLAKLSKAEYTRRYNEEVLSKLDALGKDAILLCWEMPGTFCHRRLVAGWLEEEMLGISVPERGSDDGTQTTLYRW